MMLLFLVSGTITVFLLVASVILLLSGEETVDARLLEIAAAHQGNAPGLAEAPKSGLAEVAATLTSPFKPIRDLISGADGDLAYRLALAGFRKAEHIQVYTAAKMLLPVIGIVTGTFFGGNMMAAILVGTLAGFFGPDLAVTHLISRRQASLDSAVPEALD